MTLDGTGAAGGRGTAGEATPPAIAAAPSTPAQPAAQPAAQPPAQPGGRVESRVKIIGNYVLTGKTLGKGNFARVEEAQHTATKAKVAIKIINTDKIKEEYVRKNLLREAYIMRRLNHPNVVRLYETMKTRSLYCLVTECAEGGELLLHVKNDHGSEKRLPEASARPFVRQLMSALQYMHEKGIVHRDLKMENILLDKTKKHIKIVDFGLSNSREPGEFLSTHCGSPEYAAPELFVPGKVYGQEVDVWSLGVNMFAMLAGRLPFRVPRQGPNRRQRLLEQISHGVGTTQEQEGSHISSSAMDLIRLLLKPDPIERPTIIMAMKHPWITKNGLYPMHPFKEEGPDPANHDRVLDLMCARLDVTRRQVTQSVSESRCDWVAAMYHLLHDQQEGQATLRDHTRQEVAQLLKSGNPSAPTAASGGAAAAAALQAEAAALQRQQQQGGVHLPAALPNATVTANNPPASIATEGRATPGQVATVTSVVKKLEAAAGQQLKTRPSVRRHDSTSHTSRPSTQSSVVRRHTISMQHSREDHVDGPVLARIQPGRTAAVTVSQSHDENLTAASRAAAAAAVPPLGTPIRNALMKREHKYVSKEGGSILKSVSTSHASTTSPASGHVMSLAQRFGRQLSSPAVGDHGSARRRHESPSKSHAHGRSQKPGEHGETQMVTPKKKYSFLRPRRTSKDKLSPTKPDNVPQEGISVLSELSEGNNQVNPEHLSPIGAASLSRSFALKPRAFASGEHSAALANHQPLSRSAQFGGNAPGSAGHSIGKAGGGRDSQTFAQQAPSYGQRQHITSAWTQPAFTTVYNRHSPPSVRRSSAKNRPRSVASPANGNPFAPMSTFPPSDRDTELPPPIYRYSDHAIGSEDIADPLGDDYSGNTLPSRSRRQGAFGGIFGKALRMKKQGK